MPVYAVPVEEEGGVEQPAVEPDDEVDPRNYRRHYRGGTVYYASRVGLDALDSHEDVDVVEEGYGQAAGTDEYPAPDDPVPDESDGDDEPDGDDSDAEEPDDNDE